jgi:hypothetical protein
MRFNIYGTIITLGRQSNGEEYTTATVQAPGEHQRFVKLDQEPLDITTAMQVWEGFNDKLDMTDVTIILGDNSIPEPEQAAARFFMAPIPGGPEN